MKATRRTKREAKQLFRLCLVNRVLEEGRVRQVIDRLIEGKSGGYMALLSAFGRLVRLDRAAHTAQVETAAPLPSDLRVTVQSRLEIAYGQGIQIQFAENPELIGGMRVQVGSDVYDGSVRAGLAKLGDGF